MNDFNIEKYLSDGVRRLIGQVIRTAMNDPRESKFLARYTVAAQRAETIRKKYETDGLHIPAYLIASITSSCNLHCAGCYARASHACNDEKPVDQLSADEWNRIFSEAKELGIGFILLAGGEPTLRRDVIAKAAGHPEIIFPIFTNGTAMDDAYYDLFDAHRNLVPVLSVEGHMAATDERRGSGIYELVDHTMQIMKQKHLLYGISATQTAKNTDEIMGDPFLSMLRESGARVVIYVEYVPVEAGTEALAPGDAEREVMRKRLQLIREQYPDMLFISFPGDEKSSGGCLAAGRGFFHINSHGGIEPCPFSPYSDRNIKDVSLLKALDSPLFSMLKNENMLEESHRGGCTLYEKRNIVEALAEEAKCK